MVAQQVSIFALIHQFYYIFPALDIFFQIKTLKQTVQTIECFRVIYSARLEQLCIISALKENVKRLHNYGTRT